MSTHELKTWPAFFEPIMDGRKNFEVRRDDRGFQAGDTVVLREYEPDRGGRYTGRALKAQIGYVLHEPVGRDGATLGGHSVFSLLDIQREWRVDG
jgi:hypothetical protein